MKQIKSDVEQRMNRRIYTVPRSMPLFLFQKCSLIPFIRFIRCFLQFSTVAGHENNTAFYLFQSVSEQRTEKKNVNQTSFCRILQFFSV